MELFIPLRNKLGLARKLTIKDLRKCREDITTILPWIGLFYIANTFSSFLGGITFHHEINPEEGGLAGAEIGMAAAYFLYIKNKYNTLGLRISIGRRAEGDPKKHEELTDLLSHYDPNYL